LTVLTDNWESTGGGKRGGGWEILVWISCIFLSFSVILFADTSCNFSSFPVLAEIEWQVFFSLFFINFPDFFEPVYGK
jgi:hypothetical protein